MIDVQDDLQQQQHAAQSTRQADSGGIQRDSRATVTSWVRNPNQRFGARDVVVGGFAPERTITVVGTVGPPLTVKVNGVEHQVATVNVDAVQPWQYDQDGFYDICL